MHALQPLPRATAARAPTPRNRTLRWLCSIAIAATALAGAAFAPAARAEQPLTLTCNASVAVLNTGYDGASGVRPDRSPDAHWEVTDIQPALNAAAPPPTGVAWYPAIVGNLIPSAWTSSPFGTANWISREGAMADQTSGRGDYYYRYQFYLDPDVTPSTLSLDMDFFADNRVVEVYVNGVAQSGQTTGLPQAGAPYEALGFQRDNAAKTTLNHDWQPGLNSIVVQIQTSPDYEGFLAEVSGKAVCDPTPQVSVSKSSTTTTITPNGTIDYTLVVRNTGTVATGPVTVSDPLPAGIDAAVWTCSATNGATCTAGGLNAVADTIASLPVGATATYQVTATVADSPPATITNTASVNPPSGALCAPSGSPPPCTSSVTLPQSPQVSLTKVAENTAVVPGGTVRYLVTLRNAGPLAANGTLVSDAVPSGATAMSWTCSASGTSCPTASGNSALNETIPSLPVDAVLTYTVSATVDANAAPGTPVANTATATPPSGGRCGPDGSNPPCTASATSTVAAYVSAANDSATLAAGSAGTAIANVLVNDSAAGTANPPPASVALQQTSSQHPGIVLNTATGAITVTAQVPPGVYTLNYTLCDRATPAHCDNAVATITLTAVGAGTTPIPTLDEWGALTLSGLLLLAFGWQQRRQMRKATRAQRR